MDTDERLNEIEEEAHMMLMAGGSPVVVERATLSDALADLETANERRTPADWDFACEHAASTLRAALG